jgi:hypothetical protein
VLSQGELDFLKQRAELHAKKNASRKPTKAQEENEAIKTKILALLEDGKFYTITEIQKAMGLESNQKTSALVRQLKDGGAVVRSEVKGKAYFAKA